MRLALGSGSAEPFEAPLSHVNYSDYRVPLREPGAPCTPWPRELIFRRRWQKAFIQWYTANEQRFAIKLELLKLTDTRLAVGFSGVSRALTANVMCNEISVVVEWQGFLWDIIQDFETYPQRIPAGYACSQCPEDVRPIFPTRKALWCAEVFEPFLEWVNQDLANAVAVSLSGTPDEASWARLV